MAKTIQLAPRKYLSLRSKQLRSLSTPSKSLLGDKASLINFGFKMTRSPAFGLFAIAHILHNVWSQVVGKADFTGFSDIKSTVGVEKAAFDIESQSLEHPERVLEM